MDRDGQIEQTRRFFDTVASGWTSRYDRDANVAARKARFLRAVQAKCPSPADILDFGCGSGDIARHLAEHGYRLTGYDLSEAMIAEARRADRNGRVRWLARAKGEAALPFADATFDAVVASSVLEYVPDVTSTLRRISHVLRPGGWLFATVPDMRDPIRRRETWRRRVATAPGMGAFLRRTRWREGADYLRISVNRQAPEAWLARLRDTGFLPEDLPESAGPLLLLAARKT